jgi:hypothetical protein
VRLRVAGAALLFAALFGATPRFVDSQYVLQRYERALEAMTTPKAMVYSYTISQAGPSNIEQRHRIYRSGMDVRDETLSVDGIPLGRKIVRFSRRDNPYTVGRFAPRTNAYELLFLGTAKDGHHLDYVYEATPLSRSSGAWIDRLSIDGVNFLPRTVHFHSSGLDADGSGEIEFGSFGKYWMPIMAAAQARVRGKPARERISWSDYRFPASLPPSTFEPPEPLPQATPPAM